MKKPVTLRSTIICTMGIPILLVALLFIYLSYITGREQAIDHMKVTLLERTARQATDLNLFFGRISRFADAVGEVVSATGIPSVEVSEKLLKKVMQFEAIRASSLAYAIDAFPPGRVPLSPMYVRKSEGLQFDIWNKDKHYDYAFQDWFLLPRLGGRGIWTDPVYSWLVNSMECAYSTPLVSSHGKFLGVVVLSVSVADIVNNLATMNIGGSELVLVSQFGTVVAHPDKDRILNHTLVSLAHDAKSKALEEFAYELRNNPSSGVKLFEKGILGPNEYVAYAPVADSKWMLFSIIPESVVLEPVMRSVWRRLSLVLGSMALLFISVVLLASHNIGKPLGQLEAAANKLAEGDMDIDLQAHSGIREIVSLESAFSTMVDKLEASVAKEVAAGRARSYAEEALRAKSDFLARMSHEIRTPMNAVMGMTHLALTEHSFEVQTQYLRKIQRASKNMLGILNDILDYSKIEAGKLELEDTPFLLSELRATLEDMFIAAAAAKQVGFEVHTDDSLPLCLRGDLLRLSQVCINLCNNALKFTTQGSIVVNIRNGGLRGGKCVLCISVHDTGIGIAAEAQERLFDKFSQADSSTTRRFGGTGLGLAICKLLLELMDGEISVFSVPGKGSTFHVTVAMAIASADAILRDASGQQAASDSVALTLEGRILVAEDNEINQEIISALLSSMGVSHRLASNGKEALEALGQEEFVLVLMDVQMPEMDGITATEHLRRRGNTMPVLALTANVMEEDKQRCFAAGMNGHIAKPIDPEELRAKLGRWLPPA